MNHRRNKQRGSITLLMVFFTAMAMFVLAFADHVSAIREDVMAQKDTATEQAFYAAQSCIEEGLLQLRADEQYAGGTITIGDSTCLVGPDQPGQTSGRLVSEGRFQDTIRVVSSYYADAGPSRSRNKSAIYHVFDRSGSMADDDMGCTDPTLTNQIDCQANGGQWGLQPVTTAKVAAKSFIDRLDPAFDQIGIVSFSTTASLDFLVANNFSGARSAIDSLITGGNTNSGDAIALATTSLLNDVADGPLLVEIVLTDGITNRPTDTATGETHALSKAAEAKSQGVIVFTIGLGSSVNETFLQTLASADSDGNPYYFKAPSASDLDAIYNAIADIITTYNLNQTGWREE